jgi:hypothetical protein
MKTPMPEPTERAISVVNPATEEKLARYDEFTADEVGCERVHR